MSKKKEYSSLAMKMTLGVAFILILIFFIISLFLNSYISSNEVKK